MRESLTIFAIALILVLSALLVGPYLIDWNAQRDWLAAKLSQTIGAEVKIAGPIDVKLLPRPLFRATRVSIQGATPQDPSLSAAGLDAELSINSLLQGSVEFVDATVQAPRIAVTTRADGSLVASAWDVPNPQRFAFRHVTIRNGAIAIRDEDGAERGALSGIDAQGEADTLFGPLRLTGQARTGSGTVRFRLNAGSYAGRHLRLKLIADDDKPASHLDIDGTVALDAGAAGTAKAAALSFAGTVQASGSLHVVDGAAPVPWQVTAGALKLDGKGLSTTALEVRAGADARAFVGNGALLLDFGAAPSAALKLKARQLDLDHITVAPAVAPDTPRPKPAQWIAALTGLVTGNAALPVRLSLDYGIDAVTSGDLTLTDADGTLETGAAAVFKGQVDVATKDLPATLDWLAPLAPDAADWVGRNVPVHAVALKGTLDAARTGFAARNMTVSVDGSAVSGSLAFTGALGTEAPRLYADVQADTLDTEHLPALSDVTAATAQVDLSVGVSAQAMKVAHSGFGTVETGPLALHLTKTGAAVTLDTFSVTGTDGAAVTGTATLDADRHFSTRGHVTAADAAPLATLARQLFPNAATETLLGRAALLSPLAIDVTAAGTFTDGGFVPTLATAKGTAATTRLSATITPEPARLYAASPVSTLVVLDAADAGTLLRQAGLDKAPTGLLGPGHVEVSARGTVASGFDTHVAATVGDAMVQFDGVSDGATGTGALKASGRNAAPLLQATGLALARAPASPWDAAGDLAWNDTETTASKLTGHIAGSTVSGALASDNAGGFKGTLSVDALPFSGLATLLLGPIPDRPVDPGHWIASARFAAQPAALPRGQLDMTVRRMDLAQGLTLENAAFQLRLAPGSVGLGALSGDLRGGKLGGAVTLRRDGATASLSGQIKVDDLPVRLPSLNGRASGSITLAGTGTSPDGLVASLAGDGAVTVTATEPRFDPQALGRTARLADVDTATVDTEAARDALGRALDGGALDLGTLSGSATIAAGTLRTVGLQGRTAAGRTTTEASLDIRTLQLTLRTTLTADELPKDWKSDPPQVTVTWRGPLTSPVREIDAAAFVNGLAARAIARDQDRIQLMQDDLRERAFFARRLKAMEEDQRSARDAAQAAAEKAKAALRPPAAADPLAKLLSTLPEPPPTRSVPKPAPRPADGPAAPQAGNTVRDPTELGRY